MSRNNNYNSRNGRRDGGGNRRGGGSRQRDMDHGYYDAQSPQRGGLDDNRYRQLVTEVSKGIGYFNQLSKSIEQKTQLFGTRQDSRSNHNKINEEVEKGKRVTAKVKKRLKELSKAGQGVSGAASRSRSTQYRKLANDFRAQLDEFDHICRRVVNSERNAVDHIRRSSVPKQKTDNSMFNYNNYSEDQLYAQADVTVYDEDGMYLSNDLRFGSTKY